LKCGSLFLIATLNDQSLWQRQKKGGTSIEEPQVEGDKVESSCLPVNVLKDDVLNKAIRSLSTEVMSSSLNPATECITTNYMEDDAILPDVNQNVSETGNMELSTEVEHHQVPLEHEMGEDPN
jgi:hypothetical protein